MGTGVGRSEGSPGQALSTEHLAFLRARFQRLGGECAAPGHRGSYAVVRRDNVDIGMVAVDGDLGIWFTTLAGAGCERNAEDARQLRQELASHGLAYSTHGTLAVLYFHLLHASVPAPGPPQRPRATPASAPASTSQAELTLRQSSTAATPPFSAAGREQLQAVDPHRPALATWWARTERMGGRPAMAADQVRPPSAEAYSSPDSAPK
jgi:hypothetical protein